MSMTISTRVETRTRSGVSGQQGHDQRRGAMPGYVDRDRSDRNTTPIPYLRPPELVDECMARRVAGAQQHGAKRQPRSIRRDGAVAVTGIVTFGTEAQAVIEALTPDEQDRRFTRAAELVAERLGTDVAGLAVHRDESAIHAHFQLPAYTLDGQPVSKIMTRGVLSELQDIAAKAVEDLGITRGTRRVDRIAQGDDPSKTINRSVRELHDDLPKEIQALKDQVAGLEKSVEDNGRRAKAAEDKAATAEARATAAEGRESKARERAERYRGREEKAREGLETAKRELARLQKLAKPPVQEQRIKRGWFKPPITLKYVSEQNHKLYMAKSQHRINGLSTEKKAAEQRYAQLEGRIDRAAQQWQSAEPAAGPRPEPETPKRRRERLLSAAEGPFLERYGVILVDGEKRLSVPPQSVTDRQRAAALYRGAQEKGWGRMTFTVPDTVAAQIMEMAEDDGKLDQVQFADPDQQQAWDEKRVEHGKQSSGLSMDEPTPEPAPGRRQRPKSGRPDPSP